MSYGRTKPTKFGENGCEKTALTMKSIAQMLAEEGAEVTGPKRKGKKGKKAKKVSKTKLQRPFCMKEGPIQPTKSNADEMSGVSQVDRHDQTQTQTQTRTGKGRLLLSRLFCS